MFRRATEKKIITEADDLVSRKENLDALSWRRIVKIAKRIQSRSSNKDVQELARELISIAQANTILNNRLNIATAANLASVPSPEAADKKVRSIVKSIEKEANPSHSAAGMPLYDRPSFIDEQARPIESIRSKGKNVSGHTPVQSTPIQKGRQGNAQVHKQLDRREATHAEVEPDQREATHAEAEPSKREATHVKIQQDEQRGKHMDGQENMHGVEHSSKSTCFYGDKVSEGSNDTMSVETFEDLKYPQEPEVAEDVKRHQGSETSKDVKQHQEVKIPEVRSVEGAYSKEELASFSLLYESRDGSLSVFQDKDGHLVSVDTSKLSPQ